MNSRSPSHPRFVRAAFARFAMTVLIVLAMGAPPGASAADPASEFYEDAVTRFAGNDYAGAVVQLKNALQRSPNYLPATILLGRVYLAQGRGAAAEAMMRQAARLGADPGLSVALLGESLLMQRKYRELLSELDVTQFSGDVAAAVYDLRGAAYLELQRLDDAEAAFTAAMTLRPSDPAPLVGLARLAMQRGDFREAHRLATEATRMAPGDAEAVSVMGSIAHARNKLDEALEFYTRAVELDPRLNAARLARAGLLIDLGRDDEAAADLEVLQETAILNPKVYYLQSVLADRRGEQEAARAAAAKTTQMIDELRTEYLYSQPSLLLAAGLSHYRLGQLERARDFLARYVESTPAAIGPRRLLGSIYLGKGELEPAQAVLEPALAKAPDDVALLTLLAGVYGRRGMYQSATELLTRALQNSGDAADVKTRLAMAEMSAGHEAQGRTLLNEAFDGGKGYRPAGMALLLFDLRSRAYPDAVKVGQQLVDADPRDITARNLLGSALVGRGDLMQARIQFERIVAADATFLPARINLAKVDRMRGEPEAARKRLDEILASRPNDIETLLEMATLEESLGRPDSARNWLEKARSADLGAIKPRVRLVEFLLARGENAKALEVAQEAGGIAPEDRAVMRVLASAYIANEKPEIAKTIYNDLATRVGFDPGALIAVARQQVAIGAMSDALYSLEKAINGAPDSMTAQVGAIEVMLAAKKYERAEERALALRENHPDSASAHRLVGEALLARGDCSQGLASLARAAELRDDEAMAVRLAEATASCGDGVRAAVQLTAWLDKHPGAPYARKALAELSLRNGDREAAIRHYEAVIDAFPNDAGSLNNLAYLYLAADAERALAYANRAYQLTPGSASVNDTLGWVLLQRGEASAALPYLREANSRDSSNAEIRYHLALALRDLGRADEAREELKRALESDADFGDAEAAKALYRQLQP